MNTENALLGLTVGDPAGIGPEIIIKALSRPRPAKLVVIGCPDVLRRAANALGSPLDIRKIGNPDAATGASDIIEVIDVGTGGTDAFPYGKVTKESGKLAYDAVLKGIELAKSGAISGIVTAPLHKEALSAAGVRYPGHTEILADRGGVGKVAMMLANEELRTVLVSIHCSLREAIDRVTPEAEMAAIRLAHSGCLALGIDAPRIAVAGLNPHAGEGGLFGHEDRDIILPAIEQARAEGLTVSGPWSGDTVFMNARRGQFDVVVAQYHDQGLIPVKYMGVDKGVNITLGLSFVRTSPDHGTAFDIAGKGLADESSLCTAIDYALRLASHHRDALVKEAI